MFRPPLLQSTEANYVTDLLERILVVRNESLVRRLLSLPLILTLAPLPCSVAPLSPCIFDSWLHMHFCIANLLNIFTVDHAQCMEQAKFQIIFFPHLVNGITQQPVDGNVVPQWLVTCCFDWQKTDYFWFKLRGNYCFQTFNFLNFTCGVTKGFSSQ